MVMQSMRGGAVGGLLKFALMGMLGLAVGGLVIMDVRGVYSGNGLGSGEVAKVGDDAIDMRDFDRGLRQVIAQYNIDVQTAYKLGIVRQVLAGEIQKRLVTEQARDLGLLLSDKEVAKNVAQVVKPYQQDGETLQQAFTRFLKSAGMSEKAFLNTVQKDAVANIMKDIVGMNVSPYGDLLARDLLEFQNHTRDIAAVTFKDSEVEVKVQPTEGQLQAVYESLKLTTFKIPEYRDVQVALYDPQAIAVDVTVSEEDARAYYEENEDLYMLGEQVVISQAVFSSEGSAQKALSAISDGSSLDDAAAAENARFAQNVSFEESSLLPVIGAAVKGQDAGFISGVLNTPLGYHIVRLDDRLDSQAQDFDTVKVQIISELEALKKDDLLYEEILALENAALDGKSFSEIVEAKEDAMSVYSFGEIDEEGKSKTGELVVSSDALGDPAQILALIFEVDPYDQNVLVRELNTGHFAVIDVKNVSPATYKSYESVKEDVRQKFFADLKHAENKVRVEKFLAELATGGVSLQSLAKENQKGITTYNDVLLSGALPEGFNNSDKEKLLTTPIGEHALIEGADSYTIFTSTSFSVPKEVDQAQLSQVSLSVSQELGESVFFSFMEGIVDEYNVTVDEKLLERLYADQAQ